MLIKTKQQMIDYYNQQIELCYQARKTAPKPEVFRDRIFMYEDEIRQINKCKETQTRLV